MPAAIQPKRSLDALLQLLARRDVRSQRGSREIERALRTEDVGIERFDVAARLPEEHQHSARHQAVEALGERRLADRIVDDLHPFAARDPLTSSSKSWLVYMTT